MTTSPAQSSAESRVGYFEPSRIEARKEEREELTEDLAPIFKEAVASAAIVALGLKSNLPTQNIAPIGNLIGECAESTSKTACKTIIIPGAAAAEQCSGKILQKNKLC